MEDLIYIDANMYLRFFDSHSPEFKKLLKSVLEVKDKIFITSQIEDEVLRNKVEVFLRPFNEYAKQIKNVNIRLPEHLQDGEEKGLAEWNKKRKEANNSIDALRDELEEITSDLIEAISKNEDNVSAVLAEIFMNAIQETEDQMIRAKKRKEVGNPPGKKEDPLGDQLSWEQLLETIDSLDNLWIVTNDRDYFVEYEKKCYLNPLLSRDLKSKNENLNIYCFNTLAEALKSYNKTTSEKILTLPEEESLDTIIEEEQRSNEMQEFLSHQISGSSIGGSGSLISPNVKGFPDLSYWESGQYFSLPHHYPQRLNPPWGEVPSQKHCPKCGSFKVTSPKNINVNPIYKCRSCGNSFR